MLGMLFHDLQYAARTLRRTPAFSATVVLTLALGVAASTAIVSVVYGVLFTRLSESPSRHFSSPVTKQTSGYPPSTPDAVRTLRLPD